MLERCPVGLGGDGGIASTGVWENQNKIKAFRQEDAIRLCEARAMVQLMKQDSREDVICIDL
jgi:hypothetical protein